MLQRARPSAIPGSGGQPWSKTLTLIGGGTLDNTNALVLNNAISKLQLDSIILSSASTTADSLGLDVNADSTVTALSVGHITPISIATGKTLSGAITVTAGSIKTGRDRNSCLNSNDERRNPGCR